MDVDMDIEDAVGLEEKDVVVVVVGEEFAVKEVEVEVEDVTQTLDIVTEHDDLRTEVEVGGVDQSESPALENMDQDQDRDRENYYDIACVMRHVEGIVKGDVEVRDEESKMESDECVPPVIETADVIVTFTEENGANNITSSSSTMKTTQSVTLSPSSSSSSSPSILAPQPVLLSPVPVVANVQKTAMSALRRKKTQLTV